MNKIINKVVGDIREKKVYRENEKRAKTLPAEYVSAYKEIKRYMWNTSGLLTIDPLVELVDILEEAAADGRRVTDITGPDVAAFVDSLVSSEQTYYNKKRNKLNKKLSSDPA